MASKKKKEGSQNPQRGIASFWLLSNGKEHLRHNLAFVLGLDPNPIAWTTLTVTKAYKAQMLQKHPDRNSVKNPEESDEDFAKRKLSVTEDTKLICNAKEILTAGDTEDSGDDDLEALAVEKKIEFLIEYSEYRRALETVRIKKLQDREASKLRNPYLSVLVCTLGKLTPSQVAAAELVSHDSFLKLMENQGISWTQHGSTERFVRTEEGGDPEWLRGVIEERMRGADDAELVLKDESQVVLWTNLGGAYSSSKAKKGYPPRMLYSTGGTASFCAVERGYAQAAVSADFTIRAYVFLEG
jgi:hypothetical protein